MVASDLQIVVLISGSGTTLKNLLVRRAAGELTVRIPLVVSSRDGVGGLQHAAAEEIPTRVVSPHQYPDRESFSDAVFDACRHAGADYVVMGGYLQHLLIPQDFENRVLNIHPGLIPAFCGKGYYGQRVHRAVLDYGAKLSGCTVHFVDNEYDHGPIIAQRAVPVRADDTPQSLAARVFQEECRLYPQVIQALAEGRVTVDGRRVIVQEP